MSKTERSLTDLPSGDEVEERESESALDDFIEDVPVALDVEDYDFGAMVAGVRATRKRVRIRPQGHLLARLEELAEEIDATPEDEDIPEDLAAEWAETKAAYERTFVVVVEGRSSDWAKEFARQMKAHGINPQRKGISDEARVEQTKKLWHAQIAAQIVHPTVGVTAEAVSAIFAAAEPEGDKLWRAVQTVNSQPSGESPDFSRRPSGTRRSG